MHVYIKAYLYRLEIKFVRNQIIIYNFFDSINNSFHSKNIYL